MAEVAPVPSREAVADAVDLAHARLRRERHEIQVVHEDLLARGHRLRAVAVGAHRGRRDLAQLLGRRGVAILVDALRIPRVDQQHAVRVAQHDAALVLFLVRKKGALVGERDHARRW